MSEDKRTTSDINSDDMSALSTLLQNIKGISPVSTSTIEAVYITEESTDS